MKEEEREEERKGEKKDMERKKERKMKAVRKRGLKGDGVRKSVHNMGKLQQGIFRDSLEHKRVIVLAQMLLSHNKQDTMFLLS